MKKSYSQLQREVVDQLLYGSSSASMPSIVPMEPDYRGEIRRCLTSVAFVPINTAERIQSNIIDSLREIDPTHYYYPPDTMHITIKNIRTVHAPPLFTNTDIEKCKSVFSEVSARHPPFSFELSQVVVFSTSVSVIGFCDKRLKDLILDLDSELQNAEVPDNKKYISDSVFFGNVTVCRFTAPPSARLLQAAREMQTAVNETVPVTDINLITCDSVCSSSSCTLIDSFQLSDGRTSTDNQRD
jgi:2'-5' RNA ligase